MNVLDTVAPIKEVRLKIEQDEILDLMKNRDNVCIVLNNIIYRKILKLLSNEKYV